MKQHSSKIETRMIVMPANSTGWLWHCLARETGRIGHLYSPGAQRGPWPWFPYALDNGAFSCWNPKDNTFDDEKWAATEDKWRTLIYWAASAIQRPRWAIVPDVPGNRERTLSQWGQYAGVVQKADIPLAVAVQDGMTPSDVRSLTPKPEVICVGGSTDWKWESVAQWAAEFSRVHLLRCNSPRRLVELEALGVESCDGTGWNRGDRKQTSGLENWARENPTPRIDSLAPFTCRRQQGRQLEWAW